MRIFAESDLSAVLEGQRRAMLREVQDEQPNKLLNVNESDYTRYLADKYRIEPIVFNFDTLQVSHSEKLIPVEQHPFNSGARFSHSRKDAYPRQVITFHLAFSGEADLLKCQPSSWIMWSTDVSVSQPSHSKMLVWSILQDHRRKLAGCFWVARELAVKKRP